MHVVDKLIWFHEEVEIMLLLVSIILLACFSALLTNRQNLYAKPSDDNTELKNSQINNLNNHSKLKPHLKRLHKVSILIKLTIWANDFKSWWLLIWFRKCKSHNWCLKWGVKNYFSNHMGRFNLLETIRKRRRSEVILTLSLLHQFIKLQLT